MMPRLLLGATLRIGAALRRRICGTRGSPAWAGPLLLAILLSGCDLVSSPGDPIAVEVPSRWGSEPAVASLTVDGVDPVDVRWWRSFHDPDLTSLVERLGAQNLDLETATERVIQSAAQRRTVAAQGVPHVDGTSQETYNRQSPEGILRLVQRVPGAPLDYAYFTEGLTSSWEIDLFGRIRRAVEAADAEVLASAEARHGVALSAQAELAQDYLELRGTQSRIAVAHANLLVASRNEDLVGSRVQNGVASTLDLAQSRAQKATVAGTIPPLLTRQAALINAIGLLLGEVPRALEGQLLPPRIVPHVPRWVPVGLPGTLVRRRPDVREAEARLHAATAETGVAVAAFYPSVTLTGSLTDQSLTAGRLFDIASRAFGVGPSITVPVFEGGRLKGNLELRESAQREAAISFQKTVLQAWAQVDDALTAYAQAQRRRTQIALAVKQNGIALAAARQRFKQGTVDFLNVDTSQAALLQSEDDFAEADTEITTDLVRLYRALGGGWEVVDGPDAFAHRAAVGPPGAIPTLLESLQR